MSVVDGTTPVLPDAEMRQLGFTDHVPTNWYLCRSLARGISLNFTINKATGNYAELVMNEDFGQPEYYGRMKAEWRERTQAAINQIVAELRAAGLNLAVNAEEYK